MMADDGLVSAKRNQRHKQVGYLCRCYAVGESNGLYDLSLLGVLGFSLFAVVSLLTLLAGVHPILTRKGKQYIFRHFNYMYWSVGLILCFLEVLLKLPYFSLQTAGIVFSSGSKVFLL